MQPSQRLSDKDLFFSDARFASVRVVIGIGNPGIEYSKTRHNVGFLVLDKIKDFFSDSISSEREDSLSEEFSIRASIGVVRFFKPKTFVNKTGDLCRKLARSGVKAQEIMLIHDELEKPLGYVGVKLAGSHKGHNGLKSVQDAVGMDFWRLFIGIDRPERGGPISISDYVLDKFMPSERLAIDLALNLSGSFFRPL